MRWILHAKRECLLWFLRGIADSDGTVNLRNRAVVIASSPNTDLFYAIFCTLEIKAGKWFSDGMGYVGIRATDAYLLRIFNPVIATHRGILLEKLATAKTYAAHWPEWLQVKVSKLIKEGRDCAWIRDPLLSKYGTYVKLKTLRAKQKLLEQPAPRFDQIGRAHV
jgi:hypothetical protein